MGNVYWAVRYSGDTWVSQVNPTQGRQVKERRHRFATQREALQTAAEIVYPPVCLVKVTRKPKQPPPLAVGDEVRVLARVAAVGSYGSVRIKPRELDQNFWFKPADVERVKP